MHSQLSFVAGVIRRERLPAFERLLWRACRGNVFLRTSEIDDVLNDTVTGEPVNKTVFIIFFQGDQLKTKVKKICEGFRATLYPCPDTPQERREMSIGVMTRIEDLKTVLGQTQDHRHRVLVAASKNVRMWLTKVRKIKSIYHTLNLFNIDVTHKCLIAECWCPISELERIRMALKRGTEESGSHVPSILNRMDTNEAPPTYHKTNKFTRGFQNIVDAYGIATYREINPAPYTMISFPFLFAVMFGDLGHGTIMLLASLFFILKEKQLEAARIKDEIFQTFFGGRYVIFLMGAFSIYTGLLYNDVFSKSFNIFGSGWTNCYDLQEIDRLKFSEEKQLMLIPENAYDSAGGPYPIGVDPVWNLAESNKLTFLNSMKMKISVILGIVQMTFGVLLSYQNYKYFKSELDIKFMFIPQIIFLASIFIYLCLEIIVKWIRFTAGAQDSIFGYKYPGSNCAPSLLIGLINMFMMKSLDSGFVEADGEQKFQCHLNHWYPGQGFFQTLFVLIAVLCIPVMLFAKPYMLWKADKQRRESGHRQLVSDERVTLDNILVMSVSWKGRASRAFQAIVEQVLLVLAVVQVPVMLFVKPLMLRYRNRAAESHYHSLRDESVRANINGDDAEVVHADSKNSSFSPRNSGGHETEPFELGEVMVYQAIHTIEFVLGSVSHTASYLRLWALSLAHAQLSDVLWTMVFRHAFRLDGYYGALATYILFFIFGSLSVFILVLMEGLSAFLHALRLHWHKHLPLHRKCSLIMCAIGWNFNPNSMEDWVMSLLRSRLKKSLRKKEKPRKICSLH
ncbi:V-type ATPase subunit family protein [Dictyocaulus viviparus]|uniref:V-type proton ATPase subunit a n=1 Tax=Dictyocaulus viviparus TaxID=29172 RepID=A0A0D8XQN6_DICVI|nr:V-type ATPase subunit family protein [Dictyocaulus viviparus]